MNAVVNASSDYAYLAYFTGLDFDRFSEFHSI